MNHFEDLDVLSSLGQWFSPRSIRLKEKKFYVSKLETDWKTWPKCIFFFLTCFVFVFVFVFSEQQTCQIWVGHTLVQYEIRNLIYGWTSRYNTEHRVEEVCCTKCFIVSVCVFSYIFWQTIKKKLSKQKKKLKAWILLNQTCTEKQACAAALRHEIIFFKPKHFMRIKIALWVVHLVCM